MKLKSSEWRGQQFVDDEDIGKCDAPRGRLVVVSDVMGGGVNKGHKGARSSRMVPGGIGGPGDIHGGVGPLGAAMGAGGPGMGGPMGGVGGVGGGPGIGGPG